MMKIYGFCFFLFFAFNTKIAAKCGGKEGKIPSRPTLPLTNAINEISAPLYSNKTGKIIIQFNGANLDLKSIREKVFLKNDNEQLIPVELEIYESSVRLTPKKKLLAKTKYTLTVLPNILLATPPTSLLPPKSFVTVIKSSIQQLIRVPEKKLQDEEAVFTGNPSGLRWTFKVTELPPGIEAVDNDRDSKPCFKPVIYLYPTQKTDVKVQLNFDGKLTVTYPAYQKDIGGWQVTAHPDGTLINHFDKKEYSYLFWEGDTTKPIYDMTEGFVVAGSETRKFLQETLSKMGMTPREYNEMIVFWLPHMEKNKFNLIHFEGAEYEKFARLKITPTPDSILRVFMVFEALDEPLKDIRAQKIKPFQRKGFSVVEWGGTQID